MKQAISKAIEGGYKHDNYYYWRATDYGMSGKGDDSDTKQYLHSEIFLDPLFWQALGKSLGWGKSPVNEMGICKHCGTAPHIQPKFSSGCNHAHYPEACDICSKNTEDWQYQMHSFIDHLINGGIADEFFNNLLK